MIYAGLTKDDPRVKAAWDWVRKNYSLDENPGFRQNKPDAAQSGLYYYYHTMAKALNAYDEPTITDAKGMKHDWRVELTDKLAALQKPDGSKQKLAEGTYEVKGDRLTLTVSGQTSTATIKTLIHDAAESRGVPIFGICLGHQLLGQAFGASTFKLKFGHRGANHPVRNERTGKIEITTQNHGFAIDPTTLPPGVEPSHVNLNDMTLEGLRHSRLPVFGVQYHPEASAGPHDSQYLFAEFRTRMA
jgi:hypothetical protein